MTQLTLDATESEARKVAGLDTVEDHDERFVTIMRDYAKQISRASGFVSSDNLRVIAEKMGLHPKSPNAWGAIMRGQGWIVVGRKKSELPSNHYREIRVFKWEGA